MSKRKQPINLLGVKLKQGREGKGLTQEETAIKLADYGITVKYIDEWGKGFDIPEEKFLNVLADLYEININDLNQIINDINYASKQTNNFMHRKKYVGRTLWDIFGDFIVTLIKIGLLVLIIYLMVKFNVLGKAKKAFEPENTIDEENYIVDDEYLRMLNSKNGTGKKYLNTINN